MSSTSLLLVVCVVSLTVIYGEATTCGKGEYYVQSSDSCLRCPENSFMDTENHTWRSCFACSNISDDENVLETGECSPEQNTPITKCKQGFYPLKRGRDFVCQRCTTDDCPVKNNSLCCVFSDPKTPAPSGTNGTVSNGTNGTIINGTTLNPPDCSGVGNDSNGEVKIALIVICTFLGLLLAERIAVDLYHFKIRRYLRYSRAKSADANIENTP